MFPLKTVGVCLNDEPGDREALQFAVLLARAASVERLHCVHVRGIEACDIPEMPPPERVRARVAEELPEGLAAGVEIHVRRQTGMGEIIRASAELDLDLLVTGRRLPHDQLSAGADLHRLARQTACSILFVPVLAHAHLGRLLVIADRTEHSLLAVRTAVELARASGDARPQVLVHAVYSVGYGRHYTGKTRAQSAHQIEQLLRGELAHLLSEVDTTGIQIEIVCTCSDDAAAASIDLAAARNMDALVIGSAGVTRPARLVLGGTVKAMVSASPVPVLIVKRKGERIHLLDALLATA